MILFFATALALITFWIYRRVVRAPQLPRPWSLIVIGILVTGWALAVVGTASGRVLDPAWAAAPGFVGAAWMGSYLYLFLGLAIIGLVSFGARIVRRLRRRTLSERPDEAVVAAAARRLKTLRVTTAAVVAIALGTTGYGIVEADSPQVVEVQVPLANLPTEFDGLRVVLMSDLHVGPTRGAAFTQRVVDEMNAQNADLIALTGDLTDGSVDLVGHTLDPLAQLSAPLGVFAATGNHEFYSDDGGRWMDYWDSLGIRTLRNERIPLERDGAEIQIVGVHDYTAPQPYEPDLPAALAGSDPEAFQLLLAHEPLHVPEAAEYGIDLQLSGHTHGGQMWPIRYLVPLQQPTVQGLDEIDGVPIYTTRGVGAWGPPVRVAAPPEITVVELRSA